MMENNTIVSLDDILKALRLVPEFDGNPNVLTRFIALCEQIVIQYGQNQSELNQVALLNGILNKITGPAARLINTNGIPNDWGGIRNALINNFADHRDEAALYNDLALLKQGSDSPQEYYERCQNLFSTVMTYVSLHDTEQSVINAKRILYRKVTLQSYLRGLKDPLGSRIRCMRPETIEKALEFVHEETNTMYMQSRNDSLSDRKTMILPNSQEQVNKIKIPSTAIPQFKPNFISGPFRPPAMSQHIPMQHHRLPIMQPRGQPTRTQQMFAAPPPNYYQGGAAFRIPQPKPQPTYTGPKPMSVVSHLPSRPPGSSWNWSRQGNPPPSNYFKTRDVNINECTGEDTEHFYPSDPYNFYYLDPNDYYEYNYSNYPYDCDTPQQLDSNQDDLLTNDDQPQPPNSQDFPRDPKLNKLK